MTDTMTSLQCTSSVAFMASTILDCFVLACAADHLDIQAMTDAHIEHVLNVWTHKLQNLTFHFKIAPASAV